MKFQLVLDIVKLWYDRSFRDLLVNGRVAIEDADRPWIRYAAGYCSIAEFQTREVSHVSFIRRDHSFDDLYMPTSRRTYRILQVETALNL